MVFLVMLKYFYPRKNVLLLEFLHVFLISMMHYCVCTISFHLHGSIILRQGECHSNPVVVPQLHWSTLYLFIVFPEVCLAPPSWWGLTPMHKNKSFTLVGCPLGFDPVVISFPFVRYVLGMRRNFVFIFMLCAINISYRGQSDMLLIVIMF